MECFCWSLRNPLAGWCWFAWWSLGGTAKILRIPAWTQTAYLRLSFQLWGLSPFSCRHQRLLFSLLCYGLLLWSNRSKMGCHRLAARIWGRVFGLLWLTCIFMCRKCTRCCTVDRSGLDYTHHRHSGLLNSLDHSFESSPNTIVAGYQQACNWATHTQTNIHHKCPVLSIWYSCQYRVWLSSFYLSNHPGTYCILQAPSIRPHTFLSKPFDTYPQNTQACTICIDPDTLSGIHHSCQYCTSGTI